MLRRLWQFYFDGQGQGQGQGPTKEILTIQIALQSCQFKVKK